MKKQYASYQETIDFLTQVMGEHPNLIRMHSIGETWEKRPIMMATISQDVAYADLKPAMLYTGSIHAREWIGNELAIKFISYIIENYKFNPKLLSAITRSTLYIVPCLNPDGFEYSRTHFSFWRKNRRDNGDGTFGVDLNRNFGIRFRKGMDSNATTYSGPEAFSEPETQSIKAFVDSHENITIALDYHSQGNAFFPAHTHTHETEIEGTDLNVLCANMNRQIKKVTGREYGIHRGKPPFNLIHGSGREYYYSKGIIATVVEVGTRNIPDYMQNMSKSIDENIPALLHAFSEVNNYSGSAPKRVADFTVIAISNESVTLSWDHADASDIYFEIYRSDTNKSACCDETLVATTYLHHFTDIQLNSGCKYFYNIRAVDRMARLKSPFSPEIKVKTQLSNDEFSRQLFPAKSEIGYLGEFTQDRNREHFGLNSLFIGVSKGRGICYGVVAVSLENLAEDIQIKSAVFYLYPINRVAAKIEKYGEWSISIIDANSVSDISDFQQIHEAEPIHTLGHTIESDKLTQGIWQEWRFNGIERDMLCEQIKTGRLLFRIQGPTKLPLGNDSQIMQFDVGYGRFGGGIQYRPYLGIIYTQPASKLNLKPSGLNTIASEEIKSGCLGSGFDIAGNVIYGQMAFSLDDLPDPSKTVITEAYLLVKNKNSINTDKDIRFTIELAELADVDYASVKDRQKIEFIGYEVSNALLKEKKQHHFIFDSYCRHELERLHAENKLVYFIIRPTALYKERNALIDWYCEQDKNEARLVIKYIERRKFPLPAPINLHTSIENNMVKIHWENPESEDFIGTYVVRNRFHPPNSPFDGVKLYAGIDEYTFDNFGDANIPKYYSVFSYDNVPNYSTPACLSYGASESVQVNDDFDDFDDFDELLTKYGIDDGDRD
jgi:carboxypeptidase T